MAEVAAVAKKVDEAVGGLRGLLQDVVSPDLKSALAKLDAVDKKIDTATSHLNEKFTITISHLDKKIDLAAAQMDERLKAQDSIATARHNELLAKLETYNAQHTQRYDTIMKSLDVDARLRALEDKEKGKEPQRQSA
jgi:hypothetical protein